MKYLFASVMLPLIIGCTSNNKMKSTETNPASTFDKQGHRGARGLMPENTVAGFLKAIDIGVTTLEMDVVISQDKKVVLSHDPYFSHVITTKPNGEYVTEAEEKNLNLYKMPYADIIKYDVGLKPHPNFTQQQKLKAVKPLLANVIDSVEAYYKQQGKQPLYYNIETKSKASTDNVYHPEPAEFVELLMDVILANGIQNRVIIQSFDVRTLQYLHTKYPTIKTALLTEKIGSSIDAEIATLGFTPTIYSPNYLLVNQAMIEKAHNMNVKIIPWTVNTKSDIDELKRLGVDGIITDYPNLF